MGKLILGSLPLQSQVFTQEFSFVLRMEIVAHITELLLCACCFVWWPVSKIAPPPPRVLASWYPYPGVVPSHDEPELPHGTKSIAQEGQYVTVQGSFCLGLLDSLLWGKPATMLWGHSHSPLERPMCRGTEGFHLQPAPTCQPCV